MMRIFVAGASGTLGLPLVKRLAQDGHTVIGLTRSPNKWHLVEAVGAQAYAADVFDASQLTRVLGQAHPTHVVNLLTALPPGGPLRPRDLEATNRLRTEGTANLLRASLQSGVRRVVAESFVTVYGRSTAKTGRWKEDDSFAPLEPGDPTRESVLALRALEAQHAEAAATGQIETVVLRYGFFYGPQVPSIQALIDNLRRRTLFFPKHTQGTGSWIHIADAVNAAVAALTHPHPGAMYNIADDEPAGMWEALTKAAQAMGTPAPRSAPSWLLRWAAPLLMSMAGANLSLDITRAKRELDWRPAFPNLAVGFSDMAQAARKAA